MNEQINVKLYKFQLEQVQDRLESDPNNQKLLFLKGKIERLLAILEESENVGTIPNNSSQLSRESRKIDEHMANVLPLNIGDLIEAKCHQDNQWWEAKIQSFASDRSMFTVLFTGSSDPQHCSPKEIRPCNPKSTQMGTSKVNLKKSRHSREEAATTTATSKQQQQQQQKKSKTTKQEYLEKKEAEQREKQESWKSFQQKIKGKN